MNSVSPFFTTQKNLTNPASIYRSTIEEGAPSPIGYSVLSYPKFKRSAFNVLGDDVVFEIENTSSPSSISTFYQNAGAIDTSGIPTGATDGLNQGHANSTYFGFSDVSSLHRIKIHTGLVKGFETLDNGIARLYIKDYFSKIKNITLPSLDWSGSRITMSTSINPAYLAREIAAYFCLIYFSFIFFISSTLLVSTSNLKTGFSVSSAKPRG